MERQRDSELNRSGVRETLFNIYRGRERRKKNLKKGEKRKIERERKKDREREKES